jgi:GTPase SAR1 family protein
MSPFKILVVGDSGVGKTSLLIRVTKGAFPEVRPVQTKVETCTRECTDKGQQTGL